MALFVLLSLTPLVLLTYSSIGLSERAVRREVDTQLRSTSDMSAAFLEQHMADLAELVESYAERPSITAALADGNPANFDSARIQLHLSQLQHSRAEIYGAFLTDLSGRLTDVVPPTPEIVGKDFSFRDWYKGISSTGRPYVSEAYETQIAGRPLVVAVGTYVRASPVGGEPGRPLAILAVTYRLDALQRFARKVTGLRGAGLTLTDQRGTVLAGPEGAPRGLVSRRDDRAVAAALKGRSGRLTEPGPSGDELVSYRPLQGTGWTATLRLPARTALAGVRSLRSTVLLVASVLGVALVAGLFLMARSDRRRRQAEAELEAARDQAMEGSRLKSEFVANMSHEVRTPINGVLGSAALLMDTSLDREQREYADMIRRSGESLLTVIDDILDFSKVEAGKLELEQVEFELRPLVEDAAEMVSGRAHAKGLELACLLPASVPPALKGDPNRLRQVLLNLLSNAVKFTEEGEVVVRVAVAEQGEDHVELRFEVSDTGVGIAADEADRLFEAFSQADTSTTRRYGGTGLGLAICSRLVQLMGGSMGVDSEPGRGSTFWFTARLEPAPPEAVGGLPSPRAHLEGLRVLVVDDNATNRVILEQMLTAWSMAATTASSGPQALELLREAAREERPFDVAVLDLHMPDMDGLQVASAISDDPRIAGVRLLLLSSSTELARRPEAQAKIAAHLAKPVRQSQLYDALALVMGDTTDTDLTLTPQQLSEARSHRRAHVLLAEDNEVNQKVAARTLEKMGYRVDIAGTGAEAVRAVADRPYAAVLMDCHMPEMDGYEATAEIRRREGEGRHTPIIAVTASAMAGDRERCLAAGMDDYLAKPLRERDLSATLSRWVGGDGAAVDETPATGDPPDGAEPHVLDPGHVAEIRALGEQSGLDLLSEVVQLFHRDTPGRLGRLKGALREGDSPAVREVAHALKGTASGVGATQATAVCARLEAAARDGDLEAVAPLVAEAETELVRVGQALEALVVAGKASS